LHIRVSAAAVTALAMIGVFAPGGSSAAASAHARVPELCARSYNPYRQQVSVLRACGDTILRLRRVTQLPGGGKAYDYGSYTQLVPPPHFERAEGLGQAVAGVRPLQGGTDQRE
jgi:hypothetical protein